MIYELTMLVYTRRKISSGGRKMQQKRNVNTTGMTIHLTPSNFTLDRLIINGRHFQYRGIDLNLGDTVRIRQQVGNFVIVEKTRKSGKNYYAV